MIVVDASVFVKLFKAEDDTRVARAFVDHLLDHNLPFVAPSVVLYESLAAALHIGHSFATVGELFDRLRQFGLRIEEPSMGELARAELIATTVVPGGGYPTLFDCIYHAMAIERGGVFVTADRRHATRTVQFGHVAALADWMTAVTPPHP